MQREFLFIATYCVQLFKRSLATEEKTAGFYKLRACWEVGICLCSGSAEQGSFLSSWFPVLRQKEPELLGFPGPSLPAGPG